MISLVAVVLPVAIAGLVAFLVAIAPITSAISTVNGVVATNATVQKNIQQFNSDIKAKLAAQRKKAAQQAAAKANPPPAAPSATTPPVATPLAPPPAVKIQ
jgi:hypothetical protein